jgi:hypothetical protein
MTRPSWHGFTDHRSFTIEIIMPFRRVFKKEFRSRAVEWAIIYTLYLFVAIGLIVSSAITMRYGEGFYSDPAANAAAASGGAGATAPADTEAEGEETSPAITQLNQRRAALIHSGVMASIGLASVCAHFPGPNRS